MIRSNFHIRLFITLCNSSPFRENFVAFRIHNSHKEKYLPPKLKGQRFDECANLTYACNEI